MNSIKKKNKVRVAIIGCGWISEEHCRAYSSNDNTHLVGVVDVDPRRAQDQANKFNVKFFTDYEELVHKEEIQGASVCVPTHLHKEIVLNLVKNKIHVLCEKPLAVKVTDAEEMVTEAKRVKCILMPAFCWRFHNFLIKTKNWITEGKIGKLLMFRFQFGAYMNMEGKWYSKKDKGGGIIKDSAVHAFDVFRWLVGEIEDVSAKSGTLNQRIEVEDSFVSLLRSRAGVLGTIEGSWSTPFTGKRIEIHGSQASIVMDLSNNKAWFNRDKFVEVMESNEKEYNRFQNEIDHFINCVQGDCKPLVSGEDGIESIKIADAVMESIERKKWVSLIR